MSHKFRSTEQEAASVELSHPETSTGSLDLLRNEVEELRASRERLAVAADAERRRIERDLHDGPQQHLMALSVKLQLARGLADTDPAAATTRLGEIERDLEQVLDETRTLAHRIYPPLLEAGGLAAALRVAASSAGVRSRIDVAPYASYPPEVAGAVYFCCLELLDRAADGTQATITVREEGGALVFDVVADRTPAGDPALPADLSGLQDRVEALGGRLTVGPTSADGMRVVGSLPLSR